jgi:hypothetical protein
MNLTREKRMGDSDNREILKTLKKMQDTLEEIAGDTRIVATVISVGAGIIVFVTVVAILIRWGF